MTKQELIEQLTEHAIAKIQTGCNDRITIRAALTEAVDSALDTAKYECTLQHRHSATLDGEAFYIATGQCAKAIDALKNQ